MICKNLNKKTFIYFNVQSVSEFVNINTFLVLQSVHALNWVKVEVKKQSLVIQKRYWKIIYLGNASTCPAFQARFGFLLEDFISRFHAFAQWFDHQSEQSPGIYWVSLVRRHWPENSVIH